jgi:hypothetical protein
MRQNPGPAELPPQQDEVTCATVDTGVRFRLKEVLIGIPMRTVYVRILTYAWREQTPAPASLFGETFDYDQAPQVGLFPP